MNDIYIELFGILSNIFYTSSLLPQIYKILNTKKVDDISLLFLIICMLGEIFYILYGNYRDIGNIIFSAYISLVLHAIISFLYLYYRKKPLAIQNIQDIENPPDIETIIL